MVRRKTKKDNSTLVSFIVVTAAIMLVILFLAKPEKTLPPKIAKKVIEIEKIVKEIPKITKRPTKPVKKPLPLPPKVITGPKIAFILDDWGYSLKNEKYIYNKDMKFTLAILPNLNYSKRVAILAKNSGKEVMLHLPMQPKNKSLDALEKLTISSNMPASEIKNILNKDLASVPYAKGINNHMGSLATEDAELMTKVFTELKKRKLYFIDSRTADRSSCRLVAKKINIKFSERAVFLDNKNDFEYIKSQIKQLMRIAKAKKMAIGVGHDRPLTLAAIKEMLPEIKKQGINLVFVSQIFEK